MARRRVTFSVVAKATTIIVRRHEDESHGRGGRGRVSRADLDFRRILRRLRRRFRDSQPQRYSVLAEYVTRGPSAHNAVDIFRGEWASEGLGLNLGGTSSLFDDSRIDWAVSEFGGVEGMSVLELGPLEAAHTLDARTTWRRKCRCDRSKYSGISEMSDYQGAFGAQSKQISLRGLH